MTWTESDKELLQGACANGARWALGLPGPQAVLDATDHPNWTLWLAGAYLRLGRECPITPDRFDRAAQATLQLRSLETFSPATAEQGPLHIGMGLIPNITALAMASAHAGLGPRLPMHIGLSLVNMLLTFRHDLILPA